VEVDVKAVSGHLQGRPPFPAVPPSLAVPL